MRREFADIITEIASHDDRAVVLLGDISHYLLEEYEKKFPHRFYNVGICEQTIVSMAAGLAMEGMLPVVHTIAPFCVERVYEQIKVDLCYQNLDVTIVSVGGSFDYAHLGCTHHCYEDISILRALPNIDLFAPGTKGELNSLFRKTWGNGRPKYFKLSATEHTVSLESQCGETDPYECKVVREGSDSVVFVNGHLLDRVLAAAPTSTVIYLSTISPISKHSKKIIGDMMKSHHRVFCVEENSKIGALGDEIYNIASEYEVRTHIKKIGIPLEFLENYGKAEEHRQKIGLTVEDIRMEISGE